MDLNVMRDNFNETFLAALVAAQFLIPLDCFSQILDPFSIPLAPAADATELMLGNPPLPQIYPHPRGRLKIQPYYYGGRLQYGDSMGDYSGSYHGLGGGIAYSGGWGRRWGFYGFAAGSSLGGDFSNASGGIDEEISGTKASFVALSAGVTRRFFGTAPGSFTLPVFLGPLIENASMNAQFEDFSGGSQTGAFGVQGNQIIVGFMTGAQAGVPLGKRWLLNPFVIGGAAGPREIKHPQVTVEQADSFSAEAQNDTPAFVSVLLNAGLNVVYVPWNLSVNVTSALVKDAIPKAVQASGNPLVGMDTSLFSVSWAFGGGKSLDG